MLRDAHRKVHVYSLAGSKRAWLVCFALFALLVVGRLTVCRWHMRADASLMLIYVSNARSVTCMVWAAPCPAAVQGLAEAWHVTCKRP